MATIKDSKKVEAKVWLEDVEANFDSLSSRLRPKWGEWYRLYRSFENTQKLPGQSDIFIPKLYEIIEKKVPAVVADKPRFIATPRTNEAVKSVGIVRDIMGFWWDEDKMQAKSEKWVKECFIYGVGFIKADWHQEFGMQTNQEMVIDEVTGEEVLTENEEEVLLVERPTADLVSIFDIKVDPRTENFQEGVGVMQYIHDVRFAELLEYDEDIYDLSEIKGLDNSDVAATEGDEYANPEQREQEQDEGINALGEQIDKNRMTLVEYWGVFSPTGEAKDEKEYIITSVVVDKEHKYIIRCEENELGFRPFVKLDDRVLRGEFYSIGEIEPLESLQIEYNNIRNARIDYNNAINYPEWMYNSNANINPSTLVHRPNNIIPIDVPLGTDVRTALRPVDKPTPPLSGQVEEGQLNRDFQSISQTIDFTDRGDVGSFDGTATAVKSRDRQVGAQLGNVVNHLEAAIADLGVMWLRIAEQFSEEEIDIRRERDEQDVAADGIPTSVVSEKFTRVNKAVLKDAIENFSMKVEAGSTTADTAEGKAQDAINIANTAAQFVGLGVPVNLEKIFKDLLSDSFQKANAEEYIVAQQPQLPQQGGALQSAPGGATGGRVPLQPSQPNQVL